ncbi:DNA binding protein [Mycobacterium phage Efra2]|nr:DNA binding protein [Mycobacterium phage Efra2]
MSPVVAVVSSTLDRAARLARVLNVARTVPMSVPSIKRGHGRGFDLDLVLVDDEVMPLDDRVRATLAPALHAYGGKVFAVREIEQ